MPGLMRGIARTAVIAGTATATANAAGVLVTAVHALPTTTP